MIKRKFRLTAHWQATFDFDKELAGLILFRSNWHGLLVIHVYENIVNFKAKMYPLGHDGMLNKIMHLNLQNIVYKFMKNFD